jgi:hypothetical protein
MQILVFIFILGGDLPSGEFILEWSGSSLENLLETVSLLYIRLSNFVKKLRKRKNN